MTSAYFLVRIDAALGAVLVKRTGRPLSSPTAVPEAFAQAVTPADPARGQLPLVVDLRDAKGRNDPAYEAAIAAWRPRIYEGFDRAATLVRSSVGKLQVARHAREDQRAALVTSRSPTPPPTSAWTPPRSRRRSLTWRRVSNRALVDGRACCRRVAPPVARARRRRTFRPTEGR